MLLIFGVILPLIALGVEFASGMSADIYVDPIPTWWHTMLVGFVPLANAVCLQAIARGRLERRSTFLMMNGLAMGISGIYAMIYLPISIFGVIGILAWGIGFLPLSPLTSCIATMVICGRLSNSPTAGTLPRFATSAKFTIGMSIVLGVSMLVAGEVPGWIAAQGVRLARSSNTSERETGIGLLRRFANDQALAAHCLNRSNSLVSMDSFIPLDDAERIFFEATGRPLSTISQVHRGREPRRGLWRFDFDDALGGDAVAGQVAGLSLTRSLIDTSVDAQASLGYTEWTMEFTNEALRANEARAQILLPPDAVVSRLTLWVNGEPREAAFSSTGRVRSAYQEVAVQQQRDPVLVTWKGKNRILMQCFPVPANGGKMKVRVGITAPLKWTKSKATIELPELIEQNFAISESFKHTLWVDSDSEVAANAQLKAKRKDEQYSMYGNVSQQALGTCIIEVNAEPNETLLVMSEGQSFQGSLHPLREGAPKELFVVLDGSSGLQPYHQSLANALTELAKRTTLRVLLAADEVHELTVQNKNDFLDELDRHTSRGGCDNAMALAEAWDAGAEPEGLLWIHGTQPIRTLETDTLKYRIEKDPSAQAIWDYQIVAGPNRVFEQVSDDINMSRVSYTGNVESDLSNWWSALSEPTWAVAWQKQDESQPATKEFVKHAKVKDLWAWGEVRSMLKKSAASHHQDYALRNEATEFAAAHHLVTPVSGAVVLETQEQYKRAGLVPEDQKAVVNTPEPSGGLLVCLAILPVLDFVRRQKTRRTS